MTEEQNCEEQVFPLAVNLLDRFLALEAPVLQRCQLQLLGCVCLLTASKLRQCRPIGVDLLVYYTDYSVTPAQIRVNIQFTYSVHVGVWATTQKERETCLS